MATAKKKVTKDDARKALKTLEEYRNSDLSQFISLFNEGYQHMAVELSNRVETPIDEIVEHIEKTHFLPIVYNETGVTKYININGISEIMWYSSNGSGNCVRFVANDRQYTFVSGSVEYALISRIFRKIRISCYDFENAEICVKNHTNKIFT